MHLYLVRHAQSRNNALWLATNSHKDRNPDPRLSDVGQEQVKYLAQYLRDSIGPDEDTGYDPHNQKGFGITHIYCSYMLRAVETGVGISKALGVPLTGWRDIHETGGIISGDGAEIPYVGQPGSTESYLRENYPELIINDRFGEDGWWNRSREEESEKVQRAKRVVQTLLKKHGSTENRVLMVTHGSFYNFLMREMLGLDDERITFWISNTAITRWEFHPDACDEAKWVRELVYANRIDHLPKSLVTF